MNLLGLTQHENHPPFFYSHDSSAVYSINGIIKKAASEERFTRNKHHAGFPWMSVNYCDEQPDALVIPWCKSFKEKPSFKQTLIKYGKRFITGGYASEKKVTPYERMDVIGIDHQLSHASSAYRNSGFNESLILSLDGRGAETDSSGSCGGLYSGRNGKIERLHIYEGASLGDFYGFVTAALGFQVFDGEGKVMGLAAFGKTNQSALTFLRQYIPTVEGCVLRNSKKNLVGYGEVKFNVHRHYYRDLNLAKIVIAAVGAESFAASAQHLLEETTTKLVNNIFDRYGRKKLSIAGGVFLNVKLNQKLREASEELYVFHSPSDSGATIGAVQQAEYENTGKSVINSSPYLGCEFSDEEIETALKSSGLVYEIVEPSGTAADLISKGKVVGWFQGRMEFSPRALGNRSVLASPSDTNIKEKLNLKLKQREWFMPFAPSILNKAKDKYLVNAIESPYMTMAFDSTEKAKEEIPATIHVDGTLRPQTVTKEENKLYHELICQYEKITGIPAVLNTSFNKHGLPIVCSPKDAIQHLKMGCVEALIIGKYKAVTE